MFEDDGLFIAAAVFAGVGHPPGYPLFVSLGWLASHLPFGSMAFRIHALSGLMGALTVTVIAWLVLRRSGNRAAAYLAAAVLAVSDHFWSQSIIADVYTTNTALLLLALVTVQEAVTRSDRRYWLATAILCGLGIANHWPLFILSSPALLIWALAARADFWRRALYLLALALAVAALFYAWMVWRSYHSVVNFSGAIESWQQFVSFVRRDAYTRIDNSATAGLMDKLLFVRYAGSQLLLQFGVLGGVLALFGVVQAYQNGWRLSLVAQAATLLQSTLVLIALLGFDYEFIKIAIFRTYLLPAYCIVALWLGYGIDALGKAVAAWRWASSSAYLGCALLTLAWGGINSRFNYRPHDTFAAEQAQAMLALTEPDAILIAKGDPYFFPLLYLCLVADQRPDVRLLHSENYFLRDRISNNSLTPEQRITAWVAFHHRNKRPTYFTPSVHNIQSAYVHYGFVKKINKQADNATGVMINPSDSAKAYFKKLIMMPEPHGSWAYIQRKQMMDGYAEYLALVQLIDNPSLNAYAADALALAENNPLTLRLMAQALRAYGDERHVPVAERYLNKAVQLETAR